MGDMILLPHPAVADMMVCALPQPVVNFLCSSSSQGAHGNAVVEGSVNLLLPLQAQILL